MIQASAGELLDKCVCKGARARAQRFPTCAIQGGEEGEEVDAKGVERVGKNQTKPWAAGNGLSMEEWAYKVPS